MYKTTRELDIILTKVYLEEEYLNKKLGHYAIAKIVGCDASTIKSRLIKYSIPMRSFSEARKLVVFSDERNAKISLAHKGKKLVVFSDEVRKKISESKIGKPRSEETKQKISISSKGKSRNKGVAKPPRTVDHRKKLGENKKGDKSHFWKGGITPLAESIRSTWENSVWIEKVFARDNFICQNCGKTGYLEAHHIKEFSKILQEFLLTHPHLDPVKDKEQLVKLAKSHTPFWDITNGKTYCFDCHP